MERVILHCDLNNFYASVECKTHPAYWEKPLAVGGRVENRHGIILAKNQLAKGFGVKTGETLWQARAKCPELVIVPPNFERYLAYSKAARAIYARFTDQIEPFGMDECWLDVTGSQSLFGEGQLIGDAIRTSIKKELGVTISVGVSFNKIFAKLGSDLKKPDAVSTITRENFKSLVWPMEVEALLGVGPATQKKLHRYGIATIGELAEAPEEFMKAILGKNGVLLWHFARGECDSRVLEQGEEPPMKSVSRSLTTVKDRESRAAVWQMLLLLGEDVSARLRRDKLEALGVEVHVKSSDFTSGTYQRRLEFPTRSVKVLAKEAMALFLEKYPWHAPVRAIGIGAYQLQEEGAPCQLDMAGKVRRALRDEALEASVDKVRGRYGPLAVTRGSLLSSENRQKMGGEEVFCLPKSTF